MSKNRLQANIFQVDISLAVSVFIWQYDTNIFFSVSLKFEAYYITDQWGELIKKCYLKLSFIFWHFLLFLIINLCFYHFHLFFLMKYQISATEYLPVSYMNWYSLTFSRIVYFSHFLRADAVRNALFEKLRF